MIDDFLEILTRDQAAALLQVPKRTVDYWVSVNEIPYSRLGKRCVRFRRSRLLEWLEENENREYHNTQNASSAS
jgi:excisionase family DNA binding protein